MGRADDPVLASVNAGALGSCSDPRVGKDWDWETDRVVDCALLDVLSILADTAEELELFGVLEELGPNRRFLARPRGSKAFHSAIDRVKPHFSRVLGKIGGSGWLSEVLPSLRASRKHQRPRRIVSTWTKCPSFRRGFSSSRALAPKETAGGETGS